MTRAVVPWVLFALAAGGWAATLLRDSRSEPRPEFQAGSAPLEDEIARLKHEVAELRDRLPVPAGPGLAVATPTAPAPPPPVVERTAPPRSARTGPAEAPTYVDSARTLANAWRQAADSLKDTAAREQALAAIRAALSSDDPATLLAGIWSVSALARTDEIRAEARARILPLLPSADPYIAFAALRSLTWVKPDRQDLPFWIAAAAKATRQDAEEIALGLVRAAGDKVDGDIADSILALLADGREWPRSGVIRGLQTAKSLDPRVEARLIEIVRAAPRTEDAHYVFHFVVPRQDPKSDALLDLSLEQVGAGRDLQTILHSISWGLSDVQRERAGKTVMDYVANADNRVTRVFLLQSLSQLAGEAQIRPLEALSADPTLDAGTRHAVDQALTAARRRAPNRR